MSSIAPDRDLAIYAGAVLVSIIVGLLAGLDPKLAIAATLGVTFVLVVMANITVGLCIFVLVAFLDFLPTFEGNIGLTKVAGLLLLLSWLAVIATGANSRINFFTSQPWLSYLLFFFLSWIGLSLIWVENTGAGADALLRYSLSLMLVPIVYTAVQSPKHVVWVIGSFIAGASLVALIGIASPSSDPQIEARLSGASFDPNELAAVLVAGTALAGALAVVFKRSLGIFIICIGAVLLCAVSLALTQSRGGLVAVAVVLLISPFVAGRWWKKVASVSIAVILCAITLFAAIGPGEESERLSSLGSGTGRSDIWKVGWRMVEDRPALGVGAGNFQNSSIHYLLEPGVIQSDDFFIDQPKAAHNTYLQVLSELGVVGLALFTLILFTFTASALAAARTFLRCGNLDMEILSRSLVVAVVGLLAADFFISGQFSKQLWLLLALGPALLGIARASEPVANCERRHLTRPSPDAPPA